MVCSAGRMCDNCIGGIPNFINHCVILIVYEKSTNMAVGRIKQPGGPRVRYPEFDNVVIVVWLGCIDEYERRFSLLGSFNLYECNGNKKCW
jgi:hypothetical protein